MGLFDRLGNNQQQSTDQRQAFQNDLSNLKRDPIAYAKAQGKTIPDGMSDPGQIAQYLLQSGQVGNPRYQLALQMLGGMPGKR